MGSILLLAVWAALYPSLLAAVAVMLVTDDPPRVMLGYWVGALIVSITSGLILVFALGDVSSTTATVKHNVSPLVELIAGIVLIVIAIELFSGRNQRVTARVEKRRAAKSAKPPSKTLMRLQRGSARDAFIVGGLLSFPGVRYIAAMDLLAKEDVSATVTVLVVLAFNLTMFVLLEIPLIAYTISPERTDAAVKRFTAAVTRDEGRIAFWGASLIGAALVVLGTFRLLL